MTLSFSVFTLAPSLMTVKKGRIYLNVDSFQTLYLPRPFFYEVEQVPFLSDTIAHSLRKAGNGHKKPIKS